MNLKRTRAVAIRVLRQLRHDRRFLALSLAAPLALGYMLNVFFETAENPFFDAKKFVIPVGAFVIHFITYILCAIVLVRERTAQTLSRMLINGYQQIEIISGYVLAYSLLATLQSFLVLLELNFLFKLGYDLSTFFSIYLVIWLLAVISIAMGILASNFARNEGQVFPFIPLVIIPSILFSGIIISTTRLPDWTKPLQWVTPLFYSTEVIQRLIAPGGSLQEALGTFVMLPLYGCIILGIAALTLKEQD